MIDADAESRKNTHLSVDFVVFGTCLAIIQLSFTIQPPTVPIREKHIPHGQSTWHSLQKGRLIQGLYKPIYGNCAIYFYPGVYQ